MKQFVTFDNGGTTADRYTIVPVGPDWEPREENGRQLRAALGCSDHPTDPQGVSMWGEAVLGPHLGRQIRFDQLPPHVQAHVRSRCAPTPVGSIGCG